MPKIFKHWGHGRVEPYQFIDTDDIVFPAEETEPEPPAVGTREAPDRGERNEPDTEAKGDSQSTLDFAQVQAEVIVQGARRQAEEILVQAREQAAQEIEEQKAAAKAEGYREGFNQGMEAAMAEGAVKLREAAESQGAAVEQFLKRAEAALNQQLDENIDELRDLALAVAEKVVCVSLKSSAEVIGRMIQTAVDKRRGCEWVRIYIAECDAKRMTSIPTSLTASLSALSDRVRIIPMADDETGTCIIEMPNEIVDASASTQLHNIRGILSDTPSGASENGFLF